MESEFEGKCKLTESYTSPAHNEFFLGDLHFTSKFDSGNMLTAKKIGEDEYEIQTCNDCRGTIFQTESTTWFHFAVSRLKTSNQTTKSEIIINIINLNKQTSLYEHGMQPVFRSSLAASYKYERIRKIVCHDVVTMPSICHEGRMKKCSRIRFKHQLPSDTTAKTFFAFCYPYSYKELNKKLTSLSNIFPCSGNTENIYFHRELLIKTLDGNRVDLLTISSRDNILDETEGLIPSLFPESNRPYKFQNKRYVFISARVHPGETPASYALGGVMKFLLRKNDPRSELLRKEFVFKIIPILNPDGVIRGHYRADSMGKNLNRSYQNPSLTEEPSIYAAKQLVIDLHSKENLIMYLDLHAHASKRGCFLYGNNLPNKNDQILTQLYARLVGLNSVFFEYNQCNFSEKNMKTIDKRDKGVSKEGSGRVALYRATNLVHVYTLECNYNQGRMASFIPPANGDNGRASPDIFKKSYAPKYTSEDFQDVGKGLMIALLDLYGINPWSRVPNSPWKTIENIKKSIEKELLEESMKCTRKNVPKKVVSKFQAKSKTPLGGVRSTIDQNLAGEQQISSRSKTNVQQFTLPCVGTPKSKLKIG